MAFLVGGANSASSAYEIENSLRFNDDDSSYLRRTFSGGSRTTFTVSFWVKRSNILTSDMNLFDGYSDDSNRLFIYFTNDDLRIFGKTATTTHIDVVTDRKFRDPSAWYHFVVAVDTTQGTEGNRIKVYVNGVQETSFSTYDVTEDYDTFFNDNTRIHTVGTREDSGGEEGFYDGYMSEVHYVDGTQYAASNFGETNDNGVWIPKNCKDDITYGTNGYYLQFQQTGTGTASTSTIGADTSGETNHLTSTNLAATDITTDTPTNNFCTLNSLTAGTYPELREGNLQQYEHGSSDSSGVAATMMPINGKWYAELYLNAPSAGDYPMLGITDTINLNQKGAGGSKMAAGFEIDGVTNNQSTNNLGTITNTNTGWPTFADNDIVMFALDCDNRKLWIGRQGTWINSGDPAGESNHQLSWTVDANVCPFLLGYDNSQSGGGADESIWNYGNPPFAISSSQADDNGYGNFEHDVPTGFYALCTKNLAEFG
jgi:hypothetical protein